VNDANSAKVLNSEFARRLIERKRDGGRIEPEDWRTLTGAFMRLEVDDGQLAALAMAALLRGLDLEETVGLTAALIESGDVIDLGLDDFVLDKHSSGGVGDTISLVVVPIVAACGVRVAKVSGRALGHTGGTLDKLEAIPGVRTEIGPQEFAAIVREVGCAIVAQSERLVPADKRLYALRDRTGTIPSPGLIAASMVSKKIASGADGIVYDVKCGNGAFMKDEASAGALARLLVEVTTAFGKRSAAVVSPMNEPLGPAVGTALEAIEAREYLSGRRRDARLHELVDVIASRMVELAGLDRARVHQALAGNGPYERFIAMIEAQGGSRAALESLTPDPVTAEAHAQSSGYVAGIDAEQIGELARELHLRGGSTAGVRVALRVGDPVEAGQPVGTVYGGGEEEARTLSRAFTVSVSEARSTSAMR
jgi:pyrimidine-nucleoside phosphorylase